MPEIDWTARSLELREKEAKRDLELAKHKLEEISSTRSRYTQQCEQKKQKEPLR